MQFETQKEVKFSEPEASPAVELRLHCDESPAILDNLNATPACEHSGAPACKPAAIAGLETGTPLIKGSSIAAESQYQAFSNRFGGSDQRMSPLPQSVTWDNHLKQPFNTAYFIVATAAIGAFCVLWKSPFLWILAAVFGSFALAAFGATWSKRAHPADFAINLPTWLRRTLRASALIVPMPFMMMLLILPIANSELRQGQALFRDGKYKQALEHFNLAAALDPQSETVFMELADCYNFTYQYDKSLINAEKALKLDPTDGDAWASKAWALNSQDKFAQALPAALKAVQYSPESGQANQALADAYFNLGDYALALPAATKHAQIHSEEAGALFLRARILDKLGRGEEATADRNAAENLAKDN